MIFYLSGTGNTRWVAEQLSATLGERLVDITQSLSGICEFELQEGETLGFCFPVHAWRPPMLMRRFLSQLHLRFAPNTPKPYCWSVFTQGDTAGQTVKFLQNDLRAMATPVQACFFASVAMPNTYIGFAKMDVDAPEVVEGKLKAAEQRVKALGQRIVNREEGVYDVKEGALAWFNSVVIGSGFTKWISDKAFWVAEQCVRCGKCAEACPVGDIDFQQGKLPQWKHNGLCMNCFSCYHHCPAHAIGFGKKAEGKGQYFFGKKES
ncbi:MAG: 4Fe-4S binding protein [Bacteroidales bacterium]|nr:4Fe-4S binding protein [Bacteroidales bacterium]